MTDQRKIDRRGARPASLLERADSTFGLGPVRAAPKLPPVPPVRAPARPPVEAAPPLAERAAPAAA
jgi:hypothetical protein